jgi:hypothetical protein
MGYESLLCFRRPTVPAQRVELAVIHQAGQPVDSQSADQQPFFVVRGQPSSPVSQPAVAQFFLSP